MKVVLTAERDGEVYVETPWAAPIGDGVYELDNLPFFAYGISLGDRFLAEPIDGDPRPHFVRIVRKSGNRTIRVIFEPSLDESEDARRILQGFIALGCEYERANASFVVINVPPAADFARVCAYASEASGIDWENADPSPDEVDRGA